MNEPLDIKWYDHISDLLLNYAEKVTNKLKVTHKIVDITEINQLMQGSALTDDIEVPEGHYADENMKVTVVPNRNSILINLAVAWAVSSKANVVVVGVHAGDHPIYPDCRKEFIHSLNKTIQLATEGFGDILVIAPFIDNSKDEIVAIGSKLKVPYEMSWSCYRGDEKHCGVCGTDVERKEAFKLAGVKDPTEYA